MEPVIFFERSKILHSIEYPVFFNSIFDQASGVIDILNQQKLQYKAGA